MAWFSTCLSLPCNRETHGIPKRSIWFSTVSVTADTFHCQCPWWGHLPNRTPLIEGLCETMFAHAWHACVTASVLSWVFIEDKLEHVGTKAFDKRGFTQKKSKFPQVPRSPTPIRGLQEKEPFSGETVVCMWSSGT